MRGQEPAPLDLAINLHELVIPENLLSGEELSPNWEEEEEPRNPYKVTCSCVSCGASLRLAVVATNPAIRGLQTLLLGDLSILCAQCAKSTLRHGRQ
ncbi:E7 [Leptonychotes weddellii papillomavirus 2]|uniref:Protein E7 n=1 Tax=Leptonychotes weddellii papillomavirus 2 TaxID=2077303 RepID=A0A2I8B2M8_9PAPI|nr:E7 [Leptonychotes weddellii papillomavirus 2]AUT11890.1 E7 [Leptonychotes weddellii papillomavirus 2]